MFADKQKRKEKPKRGFSKTHSMLILTIVGTAAAAIAIVTGMAAYINSRNALPIYSNQSTLFLDTTASEPHSPVNQYMAVPGDAADDFAWNRPTFASSYYADGYPSRATNGADGQPGSDMWRSAGSTGSWFYVDLGEEKTFSHLKTTLFVDANFSKAPITAFIISHDLATWYIIRTEVNDLNSANRWKPRDIFLPAVTARYAGVYALDWGGGWADMSLFMVQP